jgi:hypothetical protein
VVTTTSLAPAVLGGVVPVIVNWSTTAQFCRSTPPIVTPVTFRKLEPEIVTHVPPAAGPLAGEMLVTSGGGLYVILTCPEMEPPRGAPIVVRLYVPS